MFLNSIAELNELTRMINEWKLRERVLEFKNVVLVNR